MENQLVYNGGTCLVCKETIASYARHDFVTCSCGNLSIDGGLAEYSRVICGGGPHSLNKVYANDPFKIVRQYATRGARGKDGKQPLKWIALCDMTNGHLEAVIEYGGPAWHLELISKELQYRRENNIYIPDEDEEIPSPEEELAVRIDSKTELRKGSLITVAETSLSASLRKGKPYEVLDADGVGFNVESHHGTLTCLKKGCAHLGGDSSTNYYVRLKY